MTYFTPERRLQMETEYKEAFEQVWPTLPLPGEFDAMDACDQARWRGVVEAAFLAGRASMAKVPEGYVLVPKGFKETWRELLYTEAQPTEQPK